MPAADKKDRAADARDQARDEILRATVTELLERRGSDVTVDAVAKRAGCAKGLVHYHFKRKEHLLAAAAQRLWSDRARAWREALGRSEPEASLAAAWKLTSEEVSSGTAAAATAMGMNPGELVVQSVNSGRGEFSRELTGAVSALLERMGLEPTVPPGELGTLLAATVEGIELQLGSGVDRRDLEQAWSAFWVGLLALTRPRRA